MNANIGQTFEQIKALDGFPYNAVGENWVVDNLQGKYIVLKNGGVGLGVDELELKEHFKLTTSYDDFNNVDRVYDIDEEEDEDEDVEEIEEKVEEAVQDTDTDNKEVGRFNRFLRKIGLRK